MFREYVDRGKSTPTGLVALFLRVLPSCNEELIWIVEIEGHGIESRTLSSQPLCPPISTLLPLLGSPLLSDLLQSDSLFL